MYGHSDRPDVSEKGLYCNGGRTGFALNWDGSLAPCLVFPRTVISVNTLEKGFHRAWLELNEAIKNFEIPRKCHSCEYNTRCHYCPVYHQKTADQHLCDEAACAYMIERIQMMDRNKMDGDRVQTFGDGCKFPDGWIGRDKLLGKAVLIKRGNRTIDCESPKWVKIFRFWNRFWRIRPVMLFPFRLIAKCKRIICRVHSTQ